MRRNLVEAVLNAASHALFEDIFYTRAPAGPVAIAKAISGVEVAPERFDLMGSELRSTSHVTRALKSKLPSVGKGDIIDDGSDEYRVIDVQPIGDGRFEVELSLSKI